MHELRMGLAKCIRSLTIVVLLAITLPGLNLAFAKDLRGFPMTAMSRS
jgi:hypothetical protein